MSWTDRVVIGAGPTGCAAALAFARTGARVTLLEGSPGAGHRLAGEWLHPVGRDVLRSLGVDLRGEGGRGFVVFPADGGPPIPLEYPQDAVGATTEHHALVAALREAAVSQGVELIRGARALSVEPGRVVFGVPGGGGPSERRAGVVVGADGRTSLVRRTLGLEDGGAVKSYMAGVLLEDAALPFEGFGHVVLGGPGPMLLYRLPAGQVRLCIDVPLRAPRDVPSLLGAYGPHLPEALRPALRRALEATPPAWASTLVRPRRSYGREGLALTGDAVGSFHPLTATGMTVGLQDAECLARSTSVACYEDERRARTRVPEMLASGLHDLLTGLDPATRSLRRELFSLWRRDASERERTVRLLGAETCDLGQLRRALLHTVPGALAHMGVSMVTSREWRQGLEGVYGVGRWLGWLLTDQGASPSLGARGLRRALRLVRRGRQRTSAWTAATTGA